MTVPNETIRPSHLISHLRAAATSRDERLMTAVLEDAVHVYERCVPASTRRYPHLGRKVEAWFASDETGRPLAFRHICDALGIDAPALRKSLAQWRAFRETASELPYPPP